MKKILTHYDELLERLGHLSEGKKGLWGRMTAEQMLCHLGDQLQVATGKKPSRATGNFLTHTLFKWLVIYLIQAPKGKVPTVPEMQLTVPQTWETDLGYFKKELATFKEKELNQKWPDHPVFGKLTGTQWHILTYKHIDHHFKQFEI